MTIDVYGSLPDGTVFGYDADAGQAYRGEPVEVDPSTFTITTEETDDGYTRTTLYGDQVVGYGEISKADFEANLRFKLGLEGRKPDEIDAQVDKEWAEQLAASGTAKLFLGVTTVTVYDWKAI